jgi:hypothetical protein
MSADLRPVSDRASEAGHLRGQLGFEVFCVRRRRPANQRAVRLVIVFRALDAVSLFQPERPEPLERTFAFVIEQVASFVSSASRIAWSRAPSL